MPTTPVEVKKPQSPQDSLPGLWHSFRSEVDQLFHRFEGGFGLPAIRRLVDIEPLFGRETSFGALMPAIDVAEDDQSYKITAELPGLDDKHVSVSVSGNYLVLKGEKIEEKENKSLHLAERSYGAFERSFRIPEAVERDKIAALFAKGVLTVTLPKSATAAAAARKIDIKAA